MQKNTIAICLNDQEYQIRFVNYLMSHFGEQFELHCYTQLDMLMQYEGSFELLIVDEEYLQQTKALSVQILCLAEEGNGKELGVCYVDKYQRVELIVDKIKQLLQADIKSVIGAKLIGVYSLSKTEYQLPFILTLASILSEKKEVLVIDLQENSGLMKMEQQEKGPNLEDVFIMVQKGGLSKTRLLSCICHGQKWKYISPVTDSESLASMNAASYQMIFEEISSYLQVDYILINFGTRFMGFFELMQKCQNVIFLQGQGELAKLRELEFEEEMSRKDARLYHQLQKIKISPQYMQVTSCERLVEEWKWNEMGDIIRRIALGVLIDG